MNKIVMAASTSILITLGSSTTVLASGPSDWTHCDFQVEDRAMPTVLNGADATPQQMAVNQQAVNAYVDSVTTYLNDGCAFSAASHKRLLSRAEALATDYNVALEAYSRSASSEAVASAGGSPRH